MFYVLKFISIIESYVAYTDISTDVRRSEIRGSVRSWGTTVDISLILF